MASRTVALRSLAHGRTGDKGNRSNISVIAHRSEFWDTLVAQVTEEAERLTQEVTALYTCGPAGGGGVRTATRQRLSTASCFVPREAVQARFDWVS